MRVEVRPCYHSATDYDVVLDGVLVARFFGEMAAVQASTSVRWPSSMPIAIRSRLSMWS